MPEIIKIKFYNLKNEKKKIHDIEATIITMFLDRVGKFLSIRQKIAKYNLLKGIRIFTEHLRHIQAYYLYVIYRT